MISEQEIDSVLFLEFSGKSKGELRRIREDTLDFSNWLEGIGHTWPSAEDYDGYARERKRRVKKKESQPYEAADKAAARVRAMYEAIARQKGERAMSEVVEVEEAVQGVQEQPDTPPPVEVEEASQSAALGAMQGIHEPEAKAASEREEGQRPRRGRKPKPDSEKRVQVSVYLERETYEGVRALATLSGRDMSDVFSSLAKDFVARNEDKLSAFQGFLASLGAIK